MDEIRCLERQLKETVRTISTDIETEHLGDDALTGLEDLALASHTVTNPMIMEAMEVVLATQEEMKGPQYELLNVVQRRAHDIIERCLKDHLRCMSSHCSYMYIICLYDFSVLQLPRPRN